ncbi:MAG TPA: creatininase family protein [Vicinamibacterales bacterium]|nr:creatininase family protein [Vicinamibacterales bacterium]
MRALRIFSLLAAIAFTSVGAAQSQPQRSPAERAAAQQAEHEKLMAMPRPIDAIDSVWLEELTWLEVRDAIRAGKTTIIVPTGGMEQNGPYLATGKHNYVNRAGCEAIARKLGNALCAPNVAFVPEGSIDPPSGAMRYPGSIGVSDATFQALLTDIANSLRVTGFEHVILLGDSGGNQRGMREVAATLAPKWAGTKSRIHYVAEYYANFNEVVEFAEKTFGWKQVPDGSHDDALITAIMMTVEPDTVRIKQRIAAGKTSTNGIALTPVEKTIEVGRALVNRRADITVAAIKKAIAASAGSQR